MCRERSPTLQAGPRERSHHCWLVSEDLLPRPDVSDSYQEPTLVCRVVHREGKTGVRGSARIEVVTVLPLVILITF